MQSPYETMALPTPGSNDAVGRARSNEFAPVRVGGAIDGYQVTGALAEGGMGAVFRVRDKSGQAELALKAPLPGGRGGTYYHRMRRFLREARLTARMNHEGVARVKEQGHAEGLPYFTLELVDGVPLSERLYDEGVLPIDEAASIVEKTARAAHHVHQQGVVHRDLKPANILVRRDGQPVIIDFGLARDAWGIDPRITESGIWLGTPAYISPEQATGEASRVDARADVYSLGAILYELLSGMPPYGVGRPRTIFKALRERDPRPVSQLRKEVPEALERICMRALARSKDDRFANAEELANALADFLEQHQLEPISTSGLRISSGLDTDSGDVATGWNLEPAADEVDAEAPTVTVSAPAPSHYELVPLDEETPSRPVAPKRRPSNRLRRSSGTRWSASSGRRASAGGLRRRVQRQRSENVEAVGKLLAFCGPAAAAVLGLLLLL